MTADGVSRDAESGGPLTFQKRDNWGKDVFFITAS